ncbi:unnamed protein product, partial [Discosporangium mesarthrocarpum]
REPVTVTVTVVLSLTWSPKLRLRRPLSWLASAGTWTRAAIWSKADPAATIILCMVAATLSTISHLTSMVNPNLKALTGIMVLFLLPLTLVVFTTVALVLFPLVIAVTMTMVATMPLLMALGWFIGCSEPAQLQLWLPMVVWVTSRSWRAKRAMLLP